MNDKNNLDMELDPEVIKVRDKIITKIGDKPLEEVNRQDMFYIKIAEHL